MGVGDGIEHHADGARAGPAGLVEQRRRISACLIGPAWATTTASSRRRRCTGSARAALASLRQDRESGQGADRGLRAAERAARTWPAGHLGDRVPASPAPRRAAWPRRGQRGCDRSFDASPAPARTPPTPPALCAGAGLRGLGQRERTQEVRLRTRSTRHTLLRSSIWTPPP